MNTGIASRSIIACLLLNICLYGQNESNTVPKPIFEKFVGIAYSMPIVEEKVGNISIKKLQQHYGENIYDYKSLGPIELSAINIPETTIETGNFPGLNRTTQFCMVLNSTMKIELEGCYEFSLNSDDGSILWIDDEKIIDNDGGHQMKMVKDTLPLRKGEYKVKLWYFQGLPDRFGLQFNSKIVGKINTCSEKQIKEIEILNDLLFETNEYKINKNAELVLSEQLKNINLTDVKVIEVIGHTDNKGTQKANFILSRKRAAAMARLTKKHVGDHRIEILTKGKGDTEPKFTNENEEGRKGNRRVQIILKYSNS